MCLACIFIPTREVTLSILTQQMHGQAKKGKGRPKKVIQDNLPPTDTKKPTSNSLKRNRTSQEQGDTLAMRHIGCKRCGSRGCLLGHSWLLLRNLSIQGEVQ